MSQKLRITRGAVALLAAGVIVAGAAALVAALATWMMALHYDRDNLLRAGHGGVIALVFVLLAMPAAAVFSIGFLPPLTRRLYGAFGGRSRTFEACRRTPRVFALVRASRCAHALRRPQKALRPVSSRPMLS